MTIRALLMLVLAGLVSVPTVAQAQSEPEESGWFHRSDLGIRINPLGTSLLSDTGYTVRRTDDSDPLYKGVYADLGVATAFSPAYAWVGPVFQTVPIAFLKLRFAAQGVYYFGTFGAVADFADRDADWSPDAIDLVKDEDRDESALGWLIDSAARFQLRAGAIVGYFEFQYVWITMDTTGPYYEPFFDLLLASEDEIRILTGVFGYIVGGELDDGFLILGARWQGTDTLRTLVERETLAALAVWDIPDDWWAWGNPRVSAVAGVYLQDPWVEGQPFFATKIGVSFSNLD